MKVIGNTYSRILAGAVVFAFGVSWASATVLTVGAGGTYADLESALANAAGSDTIQFVDSAVYSMANDLNVASAYWDGLTIESAPNQRATLNFTGTHGANNNNYWGLLYGSNQTIRDIDIHFERVTALAAGNTNTTIHGVNFVATGSSQVGVETHDDVSILYCTFYMTGAGSSGGNGISLSGGSTGVLVDHVSFDNLRTPVYNGGNGAELTLLNSAMGAYHTASWAGGMILDGVGTTAFEDYNAAYGPFPLIRASDVAKVTSGGNSIDAALYTDVFAGDPSAGDWEVDAALYTAAGDGTTIGAWQVPEPSTLALLAAGVLGLGLRGRRR